MRPLAETSQLLVRQCFGGIKKGTEESRFEQERKGHGGVRERREEEGRKGEEPGLFASALGHFPALD